MRVNVPPTIRALVEAGVALSRSSRSARTALAHVGAAIDPALLPRELRKGVGAELATAVATVEPMAAKDVEKALKSAWGKPPGKVLDDVDLESPLAVAAASQRHAGSYDGEDVEIEVQRPGLASAVRGDLALLDALAAPLGAAFGALDTGALLREIRETALDELDLEHAAGVQRQVARALRGVEEVVVPSVVVDLACPTVLVQSLVLGPTLAEVDGNGSGKRGEALSAADALAVARALVRAHVVAARDGGLALHDPHPADVVVLGEGRIALRRAGIAAPVDRERVALVLAAVGALGSRDEDGFVAAVVAAGVLDAHDALVAYKLALKGLGPLVAGSARLDFEALATAGSLGLSMLPEIADLASRGTLARGDIALARSAGLLLAVLARLDATEDWVALTAR